MPFVIFKQLHPHNQLQAGAFLQSFDFGEDPPGPPCSISSPLTRSCCAFDALYAAPLPENVQGSYTNRAVLCLHTLLHEVLKAAHLLQIADIECLKEDLPAELGNGDKVHREAYIFETVPDNGIGVASAVFAGMEAILKV